MTGNGYASQDHLRASNNRLVYKQKIDPILVNELFDLQFRLVYLVCLNYLFLGIDSFLMQQC